MLSPQRALDKFMPFEKKEDDLAFNKIHIPSNFDYEKSFDVRFDDLDVNHHANNSNYISWGLEALPYDFRKTNSLKNVDIQIKKDITIGQTVISKVYINKALNQTIHLVQNESTADDLGLICIDWN